MVPMRNDNDEARRLGRGSKLYEAAPGEVIDVYPIDVAPLAARGFVRVDRPSDDDGLDDLTLAELSDVARDRDLQGRSTLNRGELIAALRAQEE